MKNHTSTLTPVEFADAISALPTPILVSRAIPSDAVEIVESRVNRLAKRAAKKGFPKPTLIVGPAEVHTCTNDAGEQVPVEYTHIAITASAKLAVAGWHLVAVITPSITTEKTTVGIPTMVPGETARLDLIEDWNRCDHCNLRRQRSETFVVENESGERAQIGRQCLRDFLGHDPSSLVSWLDATESLVSDEDMESWGSSAPRLYAPSEIIDIAARVVANVGFYVSRQKAENEHLTATGDAIWSVLSPTAQSVKDFEEDYPLLGTELAEATKRANALLLASDTSDMNDWTWNLRNAVGLAYIPRRSVGVVASSVILGQRLMEREAKEKVAAVLKAERIASGAREPQHIGVVGQRLTTSLIVEFAKTFDGQYGVTTLIKFRTAEGDLVQWWATGEWNVEPGQHLTLTGTVKAHETDRFSKEPVTTLTRCKIA